VNLGMLKFKELVEEKSNGQIKVEVYPNLQLGSLREQVEATQMGTIEMTVTLASVISSFDADLEVLQYPYLLPSNEDELWRIMDSEVGRTIADSLEDDGFKAFSWWASGYKTLTANKPLLSPDDLKGIKMRVVPSNILIEQFKAWGANPIPIDFAELYTALQQGTVEAQENPIDTIYTTKVYEVQKHLSHLNHAYQLTIVLANKNWFDSLQPEAQNIIIEAEREANEYERELNKEKNADYMQKLIDAGMTIHELTDDQIQAFKDIAVQLHDKLAQTDGQKKFVQLIRDAQ